jgi:hypothetical protein
MSDSPNSRKHEIRGPERRQQDEAPPSIHNDIRAVIRFAEERNDQIYHGPDSRWFSARVAMIERVKAALNQQFPGVFTVKFPL